MKRKGSSIKNIIVMLIIAAVIIFMYYKVSNKDTDMKIESEYTFTKLDNLLAKDMEKEYPPTAREVVKLYARILVELYGETEVSDEALESLVDMIRAMYSEKLLENNNKEEQTGSILDELTIYNELGAVVHEYYVEKADSAVLWSDENGEYCRIIAAFAIKSSGRMSRIYEQFILIKEGSKWKILGWAKVDSEEMDTY